MAVPEVLVATPMDRFEIGRPYSFKDGISIRRLPSILWKQPFAKWGLSPKELNELRTISYWLCASKQVEHLYGDAGDDLDQKARHAMLALQILCPSGAKHIFLKLAGTEHGFDILSISHEKTLLSTTVGRLAFPERCRFEHDFAGVYAMVRRAFMEGIVRLQNPIVLLEHGLQVGSPPLGALMFVMALDVLTMGALFVERIGGFLGPQSFVFPPILPLDDHGSIYTSSETSLRKAGKSPRILTESTFACAMRTESKSWMTSICMGN